LSPYKHIFFDLDRTIWDFDRNSAETLHELYYKYGLERSISDPDDFVEVYHDVNLRLWELYRKGGMTKDILRTKRFRMSLARFGITDDVLAEKIGEDYLDISPTKTLLVPHAREILTYLEAGYCLHIITNGFQTTQEIKMKNCMLEQYFQSLTTSEHVGHNKPRPEIFHQALTSVNARKKESLMIGDDLEVDILGARKFGIDQVFLNRDRVIHNDPVTYEIESLLALKEIL
jgi:putative hydrolase of the HAD superfamily